MMPQLPYVTHVAFVPNTALIAINTVIKTQFIFIPIHKVRSQQQQ